MTPTSEPPSATEPTGAAGEAIELLSQSDRIRVWRERRADGSTVVVKQPLGADALARAARERATLQRLAAVPGVVHLAPGPQPESALRLHDVGGEPLVAEMRRRRWTAPEVVRLALQLARTLAAIHRVGLSHLNLCPDHILLGAGGHPVLAGFQLASGAAEAQPGFMHPSAIAGTLAYMAPEQTGRSGRTLDQRADLYALGAVLYELATGRRLFATDDPLALIHAQLARMPLAPVQIEPRLPPVLSEIVMRLLEKDADRRYQSAEGLANDLERLSEALARGDAALRFALGESDFPLRLTPPSRLVGRGAEVRALRQALDDAMVRGTQMVLVRGGPGVGKTALVNELREAVTEHRGWFVGGKSDQFRRTATAGVGAQAMHALGTLLLAEPEEMLAGLRPRLAEALGVNADVVVAVLPELGLLTGITPAPVPAGDPAQVAQRFRQGVIEVIRAVVGTGRPLVIVLDDLQWAPPRTYGFVDALLDDGALTGLLVVGVCRDGADLPPALALAEERWVSRRPQVTRLTLHNLPPAALSEMLAQMLRLPAAPAGALAALLAERSAGNPFDTVELLNAMRSDGVLALGPAGWHWDDDDIRRYVGHREVVDLLASRIERLPAATRSLLEALACLGLEAPIPLLQTACGYGAGEVEAVLAPALEDGLLVLQGAVPDAASVRFRHDRVQQAAYARLCPAGQAVPTGAAAADDEARTALQLALARRLAPHPAWSGIAAEQYLGAVSAIVDEAERRRVIELFHATAAGTLATSHAVAERLAGAAGKLLRPIAAAADAPLQLSLARQRIAALHALGRHDELDAAYGELESQGHPVQQRVTVAYTVLKSLGDRSRHVDALKLGLALLRGLGVDLPEVLTGTDAAADDEAQWAAFYRDVGALDLDADLRRAEIGDARLLAVAEVLERMLVPAYFTGSKFGATVIFEGLRLWHAHGPCAALINVVGGAVAPLVLMRQDFATGYRLLQHALAVGLARGWDIQTADTRHYLALLAMPWFEPLEHVAPEEQRARHGMVQWGLLPQAAYTYTGEIIASFECEPTLEATAVLADTAEAFAARVASPQAGSVPPLYRQLVRAMRGETEAEGSLRGPGFDDAAYRSGAKGMFARSGCLAHTALAAAIFGQLPALAREADEAMPLVARQAHYRATHVHLLHGLAIAQQAQAAGEPPAPEALQRLDHCLDWFQRRAADAPENFAHLASWIDAERAWALQDTAAADARFAVAMRRAERVSRPWHQALIAERAGLYFATHGPRPFAHQLLALACRRYEDWGATAKVRQMRRLHPFLQLDAAAPGRSTALSRDSIDTLAILRASQVVSSETTLAGLKTRVAGVLGALTGADSVVLLLRAADGSGWSVSQAADEQGASVALDEAAARALLPITPVRYVLRTRQPLVVADAIADDRFGRDPYMAGREHCSLMVVPILSKGEPHAVLLLENRLSRAAFSAEGLDAVMLIAGQLAVSLDNATLYASLEQKVAQRTAELQELVSGLESFNRSVSHDLRGPLGGIAGLAGLAIEALEAGDDSVARRVLPAIANQAESSTRLVGSLLTLARVGDARLQRAPVELAPLVHEVLEQLAQAEPREPLPPVDVQPVPTVMGDVELLRPVMVNLLANAIKFVRGRPSPHIEVGGSADDREVTISVCDNGVGFPSDEARTLFQPFTRLHGKQFAGHGVGLSIVRRAVERHGGRVWATSEPDRGACFYFTLPKP